MRIFGAERLKSILRTFKIPEGESISHSWITKAIRKAQQKVEEFHFDIRKNVLKFDDVMNEQRKVIFAQRKDLMAAENVHGTLTDMRHELIAETIMFFMPPKSSAEEWDFEGLRRALFKATGLVLPLEEIMNKPDASTEQLIEFVTQKSDAFMTEKFSAIEENLVYSLEKNILLQVIDAMWKEHLQALDFLKKGISLRGYGQKDPLNEYKKEAFALFENMLDRVRQDVIAILATGQFNISQPAKTPSENEADEQISYDNIGRNQPCPCGSGKKFKHCHGKVE